MNISDRKNKIKNTVVIASSLLLVAGCSSTGSHAKYQTEQAPVYSYNESTTQAASMGATGTSAQTQTGAAMGGETAGQTVIPLEKETVQIGTQPVNTGGVQLRKVVRTETVTQPVQVRKESIVVERIPAGATGAQYSQGGGGTNSLSTPFQGGELVINLQDETPVIHTQTVPAGSVVVRKQVSTQPMNVQQQVRREDVVAVPIGNTQAITISSNVTASSQNEAVGAAPSTSGQSTGAAGSGAITQLNQLSTTADPTSLAGQTVNISEAKVQRVIGDRLLVLQGSDSAKPVYVVMSQPMPNITAGQTVSLNGTVQQVPSSPTSLGLDQQGSQMLQDQQIFVRASSVTPISK
ncbi:YsnF/AvaK domain-containing protein [Pedosphaera parvula]|uniref:DUF2382 domain-containing protein n=1 Tax=Pedosphaera parvula (strain Ellin514) TaxID=320771 RepID=B9XC96_PEDPL|nr:YsnF/AvaK domain-containing protein [Pedosphaera parvula]EEF62564.1 conserved hypothetical protein [Pedosphaera parvula Ellin514]